MLHFMWQRFFTGNPTLGVLEAPTAPIHIDPKVIIDVDEDDDEEGECSPLGNLVWHADQFLGSMYVWIPSSILAGVAILPSGPYYMAFTSWLSIACV